MTPEQIKLLVLKPINELQNVSGIPAGKIPFYDGGGELKLMDVANFNNLTKTAIPLKPSDPTPTLEGLYIPTQSGTYANAGGLVAQEGYYTLFFFDGTIWTKSETFLPANNVKIPLFEDLPFPVTGYLQTMYNDVLYYLPENITAEITDLPTNNPSKWRLVNTENFNDINFREAKYPANREITGFTANIDGAEYYGEKEDWFDGKERKLNTLIVGSENTGTATVGLFTISETTATLFSSKVLTLADGENIFSPSEITDLNPVTGIKYYVLFQGDGTTIGQESNNAGKGHYISTGLSVVTTNFSHSYYLTTRSEEFNVLENIALNNILADYFLLPSENSNLDAYNEWYRQYTNNTKTEYEAIAPLNELDAVNKLDLFFKGTGTHTNKLDALNSICLKIKAKTDNESVEDAVISIRNKFSENLNTKSLILEVSFTDASTVILPTHEKSNEVDVPEYFYEYDYVVDWGDGTFSPRITTWNDPLREHTYYTPGNYQIKITGKMTGFIINEERYPGSFDTRFLWSKVIAWGDVGAKELVFGQCENLRVIPRDKIGGLRNLIHAKAMFFIDETPDFVGAGIQRIPNGLLDYAENITRFHYTFHGTSIHEIPDGLFYKCASAFMFQTCFEYCRELQNIPEEIFRYNPEAYNFTWVFNGCHALRFIPENVFKWSVNATQLKAAFGETRVSEIPEGLLRYTVNAVDISGFLYGATGIITVPENLLKYCTEAIDLSYFFDGSPTFKYIPEEFFRYNTKATNFFALLRSTNVEYVPPKLFKYNTLATSFEAAFKNTPLKLIPTELFLNTPDVVNFKETFQECSDLTGDFPKLWESHPLADGTRCFEIYGGQSNLKDSKFIPKAWAGDMVESGRVITVKNGGFDIDLNWNKGAGSFITEGIGKVKSLGALSANSGGINQTTNDKILNGDKIYISVKVRQTKGIGNFQMSIGSNIIFNRQITSNWQSFTFETLVSSITSILNFGGETIGDEFEIDDISIKKIVENGSFDLSTGWEVGTIVSGVGRFTAKGDIAASSANWGIYQAFENQIPIGTNLRIKFKARQISGSGFMQAGLRGNVFFEQAVTGSFVEYSIDVTAGSLALFINFGGLTVGNVFEIDDVQINIL